MAAIVERDDTPARLGQRRDPAWMHPVDGCGRRKAVNENDRIALPLVEVGNLDLVVPETLHNLVTRPRSTRRSFRQAHALQSTARPATLTIALGGTFGHPFDRGKKSQDSRHGRE